MTKYMVIIAFALMMAVLVVAGYVRNTEAQGYTNDLEARVATIENTIDQFFEEFTVHEEHILALEERADRTDQELAKLREDLDFQAENIEELELLQWNDPAAVADLVYDKIWERAISCRDDFCYQSDEVLYAFYTISSSARFNYIQGLFSSSTWTAENQGDGTWLVIITDQNGYNSTFVADSIHSRVCYERSAGCLGNPLQ
jgi:hypothetical protein